MSTAALRASGLTKVFRPRRGLLGRGEAKVAVDAVSLEVAEGELFVLLGENGAGKTTLVKLLATLVLPTSGRAEVLGHDVERESAAVRRVIGLATPDERSFFWRLSGRQNLNFFAALHGLHGAARNARIDRLADELELDEFLDRRFDGYSSGMKQRMSLARSLLGEPRVLFLDEPTRSLDPHQQHRTQELIRKLSRELTVVLVTHQLAEARALGQRIGVMAGGKLTTWAAGDVDLDALFKD